MEHFSANLGFLWAELPMADRIRRAAATGFGAVEMHWPYENAPDVINNALAETGAPLLSMNTSPGDRAAGDFGLSALKGREAEAREAIDQALDYAHQTGCRNIHVLAGRGGDEDVYIANLAYAAEEARDLGIGVLIEPLNQRDFDDYFLCEVEQAAEIVRLVGAPNLRIMFDCYHVQIMQGDLMRRIEAHLPFIGHIQIAAAPSRAEPDEGEIAYDRLIPAIREIGYLGWIGAEYRPRGVVEDGLKWMNAFHRK
jgi:hydroxypyruvate isomerase